MNKSPLETKLYKRRWLMLLIFCSYSATNAFQWLQYATINNIIARFYNQPSMVVDWLSMVYMLVYIPLIFPANWLLDTRGLMPVALFGSFGNALGAIIKIGSAKKHLFPVTFLGQTISAIAQIFILGIPAELAAVWFGPNEVSRATALGVFGNQVGNSLGFLLPPVFVPNPDPWNEADVQKHLLRMFYVVAGVTCFQFFMVVLGHPPLPPSQAQAALASGTAGKESYLKSIKTLMKHKGFVLLFITYADIYAMHMPMHTCKACATHYLVLRSLGLCVGTFYAISTLLNQVVLFNYPGEEVNVGRIGLLLVVTGMVGSVLIGFWLDKTHKYKWTTLAVYILTLAGMALFTISLPLGHLWLVFVAAGLLGLFMSSYLPLGFEFAAEITYPASEGTTSGLLNASAQICGIILTTGGGALVTNVSVRAGLLLFCGVLAVGAALTALIFEDLRRQRAEHRETSHDEEPAEINEVFSFSEKL